MREENRKLNPLYKPVEGLYKGFTGKYKGFIYQQTKKVFKEQFKMFRGLIKSELGSKGTDNQFEREHKREMSRYQDFDREK